MMATVVCETCGQPAAGRLNGQALCQTHAQEVLARIHQAEEERQRAIADQLVASIPTWVWDDTEWAPVLWLLTAPVLQERKALGFVDVTRREIDWDGLRAVPWSRGGRVLVDLAWHLWSEEGTCSPRDWASVLDRWNAARVLEALALSMRRRVIVLDRL